MARVNNSVEDKNLQKDLMKLAHGPYEWIDKHLRTPPTTGRSSYLSTQRKTLHKKSLR